MCVCVSVGHKCDDFWLDCRNKIGEHTGKLGGVARAYFWRAILNIERHLSFRITKHHQSLSGFCILSVYATV